MEKIIRFKGRLEKNLESYVEELSHITEYNNLEKQLKILKLKIEIYKQLNERFKSDALDSKTKTFISSLSKHQSDQKPSKSRSRDRRRSTNYRKDD